VPLIAYGGRVKVVGPQGEREIEADKFFVMPDRNMFGETVLEPNELVTEIVLPTARNTKSAMYEVKFKQAHDWPIAMAAVALRMNGGTCESARVVLGAVAPIPWRSRLPRPRSRARRSTRLWHSRRQRRRSPMRSP
jgi:xanthine dehydrogenase YagS FAD-binding subunit